MNDRRDPVDVPGMTAAASDCGSNLKLAKKIRWIQKPIGTPTHTPYSDSNQKPF